MLSSFSVVCRSIRTFSTSSISKTVSELPIILGRSSKQEFYSDRNLQAWSQAKDTVNFDRIGIKTGSDFIKAVVCDGVGDKPNSAEVADCLASSVLDFSDLKFMEQLSDLCRSLPDNGASTLAAVSIRYTPNDNSATLNACIIGDSFLNVVNSRGKVFSSSSDLEDLKSKHGQSFTPSVHLNASLSPRFYHFTLDKGSFVLLGSDGFDVFEHVDDWAHVSTCIKNDSLRSFAPWLRSNISEFIETDKDSSGMMLSAIRDNFSQKGFNLNHFNPTHLDDMSLVAIEI